jgi:hypothetical protein
MNTVFVSVFDPGCFIQPATFQVSFWKDRLHAKYFFIEAGQFSPVSGDQVGMGEFSRHRSALVEAMR